MDEAYQLEHHVRSLFCGFAEFGDGLVDDLEPDW